jgi:hypothetical protein
VEARLPAVLMLPMTHVVDRGGRLVASYAGALEMAPVTRVVERLIADRRDGAGGGKNF